MIDFEPSNAFDQASSHNIVLYHGSYKNEVVKNPMIKESKWSKDFNQGFYCTNIKHQAIKWSIRFTDGVVSLYNYYVNKSLNMLCFNEMTEEWLDFIIQCRSGQPHSYDIVEGPMADDQIYDAIKLLLSGCMSRIAFWDIARFRYPKHQIGFQTSKALKTLDYLDHLEVKKNDYI